MGAMIPRQMEALLRQYATWFPAISVTGPRQSGKSTLVKAAFPDFSYVNLEDPQLRREANEDPVGFIRSRPPRLILDEAQYAPELFSMVQVASDERGTPGQYVLSGSQNFLLLRQISQTLAGRVGVLKLLPLSFSELNANGRLTSPDAFMARGGYPRLYDTSMPTRVYFESYINTYVERDVADYLDVRNLSAFRTFLKLCALNAGSLVNYASLARDAGIDARTAKSWLSLLESSYVAFFLMPYHTSEGKRLIKAPKLYFYDTGLLCHLLGVNNLERLLTSEHLGQAFENLIVAETLKGHLNKGEEPRLFFYRDDSRIEVDLLDFTDDSRRTLVEIKSSQTYRSSFARHLRRVGEELEVPAEWRCVVTRAEHGMRTDGVRVLTASDWLNIF